MIMRCHRVKVTVEPIAFLALFSLSLLDQVTQQYVFKKLKTKAETSPPHLNGTNLTNLHDTCNTTTTSTLYFLDENVLSSEAGQWLLYLKLAAIVPSLFTSLILGIWSDKSGRKIGLLVAACGGLIQVSLHLLVINLDLSVPVLLVGNIAYGISGYITITIAICMAYFADITSKQDRTVQIVFLSTLIGFGKGLADFVSHFWVYTHGFVPPLWLVFGCNILNIMYIFFILPETIVREYKSILGNWKLYILNMCQLFSNGICRSIWCQLVTIYSVSFIIVAMVQLGCQEAMLRYSVNWPICFDEAYVRYFSGAMTCTFITSLLAVKLFQFVPRLSDHWIIEFGLLSAIGGLVLTTFSKTALALFMVPVAGMLAQVPLAVLRACLSKVVDFHQQGLLFAVIGCVESISWLTGYLVFGSLYHTTKHTMRGMTFLIGAGIIAIPTTLLGVTQFYQSYRSYNFFVEAITSHDEVSTSDSEDSETAAILGQNQTRNHDYKSFS